VLPGNVDDGETATDGKGLALLAATMQEAETAGGTTGGAASLVRKLVDVYTPAKSGKIDPVPAAHLALADVELTVDNIPGYLLLYAIFALPVFQNPDEPVTYITREVIEAVMGSLLTNTPATEEGPLRAPWAIPGTPYMVRLPLPGSEGSEEFYSRVMTTFIQPVYVTARDVRAGKAPEGTREFAYDWQCVKKAVLTHYAGERSELLNKMLNAADQQRSVNGLAAVYQIAASASDSQAIPRAFLETIHIYAEASTGSYAQVKFEITGPDGVVVPIAFPPAATDPQSKLVASVIKGLPANLLGDKKPREDAPQKIGLTLAWSLWCSDFTSLKTTSLGDATPIALCGESIFIVSILVACANMLTKDDAQAGRRIPRTDPEARELIARIGKAVTVSGLIDIIQDGSGLTGELPEAELLVALRRYAPFEDDALALLDEEGLSKALGKTLDEVLDNYFVFIANRLTPGGETYARGRTMVAETVGAFAAYAAADGEGMQRLFQELLATGSRLVVGTALVQVTGYKETLGSLVSQPMATAVTTEGCPDTIPDAQRTVGLTAEDETEIADALKIALPGLSDQQAEKAAKEFKPNGNVGRAAMRVAEVADLAKLFESPVALDKLAKAVAESATKAIADFRPTQLGFR